MVDVAKLYRKLLKLYPASFRQEYEGAMTRQFRDEQRDAQGWKENVGLLLHALSDIAVSAPRELVRELSQDSRFALRVYRRRPLSAVIAIGTLALAVGASTGVFSVTSALLLRSAAVRRCITIGGATFFAIFRGKWSRRLCRVAQSQFLPGERCDIFHIRDEPELGPRCPASSSHRDFCKSVLVARSASSAWPYICPGRRSDGREPCDRDQSSLVAAGIWRQSIRNRLRSSFGWSGSHHHRRRSVALRLSGQCRCMGAYCFRF